MKGTRGLSSLVLEKKTTVNYKSIVNVNNPAVVTVLPFIMSPVLG